MSYTENDGRRTRSARTRARLTEACFALMYDGCYRPPMTTIAKEARVGIRSAFDHYGTVDNLWRTTLDDDLRRRLVWWAIGQDVEHMEPSVITRLANAIVFHARTRE